MSPLRSLLRKFVPARFLARVNYISHADDRAIDLEYRLQKVTRLFLQQRYPKVMEAGSDSAAASSVAQNGVGAHQGRNMDGRTPYQAFKDGLPKTKKGWAKKAA